MAITTNRKRSHTTLTSTFSLTPYPPADIHWESEALVNGGVVSPRPLVGHVDGTGTPVRPVQVILKDGYGEGMRQTALQYL